MATRGGPTDRNPYTGTGYTGTPQPAATAPLPGQVTNAQQSMSNGYTPYVPPVGNTPAVNTAAPQIAGPPAPNAPGVRPSAMGGTQAGINQAWAYDVATKYNPQTNANLQYDYQQQLDQYQRNGNRVWDWGNPAGGWIDQAPVAPIYLSTDYQANLDWTNQNTPGELEYGQANPDFMRPFTQQNKMYAGTLTPWSTQNTNLNYANTAMLPDTGKTPTINFPNGIAPGSGQNAYNMMGVSPTEQVFAGNGGRSFPNAPTQPNPFAKGMTGVSQNGAQAPNIAPGGVAGNGQAPGQQGQGGQAGLLALLSLLFGGGAGQQQPNRQSPFFNNNRSQYYPNTGGPQTAPAQNPNDLALLKLLFGGQ
jgi:hypothetical protein